MHSIIHDQRRRALMVNVYRCAVGDCTNHGVSELNERLLLIGDTVEGYISYDETFTGAYEPMPVVVLIPGRFSGYARIVPALPIGFDLKRKPLTMFGGNFAYSSDDRFARAVERICGHSFSGAVPIHDRIEG